MYWMPPSTEYDTLIKSIQRKRKMVIVLTIIAVLFTITACSPIRIEAFDNIIVDYKGIHPIITALLVLAIFILELVMYAVVSSPTTTSMDIECDPKKHLILNDSLNKQKNKDYIYAVDYIYMGNFEAALYYANKMISDNSPSTVTIGLFNKARCEFFLGDFDSLKATVTQYKTVLSNMKNINQKAKDIYMKIQNSMDLLIAISDKEAEKISALSNIEPWNNSKATQGYITYLKGVAAYILKDEKESIYRFMYVKENCEKTVFAQLSEQYLSRLNNNI